MNNKLVKIKIAAYVVLIILAVWLGGAFYTNYKKANALAHPLETNEVTQVTNSIPATNQTALVSNTIPSTNESASTTNTPPASTNELSTNALATNASNQATNLIAAAVTNSPPSGKVSSPKGSMIAYFGAFIAVMVILGLLIAYDVSQFFGSHTVDFLFNDEGKGIKDPEYEEAEQAWANGKPLDAIQMMRDYLKKNPSEQYAALRIAEIYEKDLKNELAAALEYEQILLQKLPAERWGWAAIHLCNLYFRMGKTDKAVELLRRIVEEYGETAAAKKARTRLALFEAGDAEALGTDFTEGVQLPPPPIPAKQDETPESNLPPGFRPKK
ncbi:MAG: tetratricopeptide repeat protein [Verrucomicrobiota bacterium]|nr:tetratricopeptide repeat protein [Verrucomicrobiota bacterium]